MKKPLQYRCALGLVLAITFAGPLLAQTPGNPPQSRIFPEPDAWNGQESLFIQCTGCSEIRYTVDGEEKKYAGPIALPPAGGEIRFYGISIENAKEREKVYRYEAGAEKPWRSGVLMVSPLYFMTLGGMRSTLPAGFGGLFSYEQGLDGILDRKKREWMIPGLKIETGIVVFEKNSTREIVVPINAGPVWLWSPLKNHNGQIFTAATFGLAYIKATVADFAKSVLTSNLQWSAGYRYIYESLIFEAAVRYGWFFDKNITLGGLGFSVGIGYAIF